MPTILSIGEAIPPFTIRQDEVMDFSRRLFSRSFVDIERLLGAFQNGQIAERHFTKELKWYERDRSFEEKNEAYIESAIRLGTTAIKNCLHNETYLANAVPYEEIDAIFMISSTGFATPSIEARIMNVLPFTEHTKRIPIWGLGCAGGAAGLSRAYEYCLAYPDAKALVLTIELCSLTFQRNDHSKSNLVGTSLFADGVACALMVGDQVDFTSFIKIQAPPTIVGTLSTLMKDSLDVMGWDIRNEGLFVVFSKHIPSIIENWLKPNVNCFLSKHNIAITDITHFVAHPGGKKVLDAYVNTLNIPPEMTSDSFEILRQNGNMSSSTILYVLNRIMKKGRKGDIGLATALGPGFSSELLLLRWV